jgi:predicted metal-dependent HD superfamily phosphohydrolase
MKKNKPKSLKPLKGLLSSKPIFKAEKVEDKSLWESTISDKHYTPQGDHPEDRIYRDKAYIKRLQQHIDEVYTALEKDLNLKENQNWLFDYIYNEDENFEFEDYLSKYKVEYKTLVK